MKLKSGALKIFPANATSVLQPLDLGIIQNVKVLYRREQIDRILAALNEKGDTSKENMSVDLLQAIRFLDKAYPLHLLASQNVSRRLAFVFPNYRIVRMPILTMPMMMKMEAYSENWKGVGQVWKNRVVIFTA